jgi:hypothetical protein
LPKIKSLENLLDECGIFSGVMDKKVAEARKHIVRNLGPGLDAKVILEVLRGGNKIRNLEFFLRETARQNLFPCLAIPIQPNLEPDHGKRDPDQQLLDRFLIKDEFELKLDGFLSREYHAFRVIGTLVYGTTFSNGRKILGIELPEAFMSHALNFRATKMEEGLKVDRKVVLFVCF